MSPVWRWLPLALYDRSNCVTSFVSAAQVLATSSSVLASPLIPVGVGGLPCYRRAQVVFARGTGEDPGVGPTGQEFVDQLRAREAGKSVDVYPVNYPASNEWSTGLDGITDAGAHVVSMAANCPKTKMVLGGYSQGAAVMGFVTSAQVPDGVDPATVPKPLSPDVADHVAAVVLFGIAQRSGHERARPASRWSSARSIRPRPSRSALPRTRCARTA